VVLVCCLSRRQLQAARQKQKARIQLQAKIKYGVQPIKNKKRWVFNYSAFSILTGIL
jgi:hypothetical protein